MKSGALAGYENKANQSQLPGFGRKSDNPNSVAGACYPVSAGK
jgi:hypothetical protein